MTIIEALLPYIQIILSVLLVTTILMQQNEAGLGAAFGGGDSFGSTHHTRRGFEKLLFKTTIVLAVLFALSAFVALLL
ncbi:MAG: preprotein translocase subunit SecG [Candidatus Paceibacterota bacterium]